MFKQMQEIPKLDESRGENSINKLSLACDKQSSRAQIGVMNCGIRVRDPSQMFVFGDMNWVKGFSNRLADSRESAGLLTKNRSQQAGIFGKPFVGNQSSGSVDLNLCNKDGDKSLGAVGFKNMFAKTENFSGFRSVQSGSGSGSGSVLMQPAPAEASNSDKNVSNNLVKTVNHPNPLRISQQMDHCSKSSQSPITEKSQLPDLNHISSHVVSVKKEDDKIRSTSPTNTRLDAPLQHNPVTGSCELPSTSCAANTRIRNPSSVHLQQLDASNQNTRSLNSKKRKASTFRCLPNYKEVTEGSSSLHDISPAELAWAHSVARLPEKQLQPLDEETADSCWIINRKRRLSLTTQLMQLLFQPPPAIVLTEDAVTHCDIVAYYATKLALDARSLCLPAGKNMTSKSRSEHDVLEVIEGFIGRSKRLEDDVSRLEKGGSPIHEVILDFQDLEKFSFVNRLAKFHGRRPMVTSDTQSSTVRKLYPQRYVKAIPMPKAVPEEEDCLFL